jgi:transposase
MSPCQFWSPDEVLAMDNKKSNVWTLKEATKYSVIQQSLKGIITVCCAADQLGISERQVYRLRRSVGRYGANAVRHKSRGRKPINGHSLATKRKVLSVYRQWKKVCDEGLSAAHLRDILEREHGLALHRQTVWRWLSENACISNPRRKRKHRTRRVRSDREGLMLFLDGSPHHWYGKKYPKSTLILCSDDATGKALWATFMPSEDLNGCFETVYHVFQRHGLPAIFYTDRASQFKTTRKPGTEVPPTHWQNAMRTLGIKCIYSQSPQARGRIERLNGIFQARLVHELQYRKIRTNEEATKYINEVFIPQHNEQFAVEPISNIPAWRPVPQHTDLRTILCTKELRRVSQDNVISHKRFRYQLLPLPAKRTVVGQIIEVQGWFNGKTRFYSSTYGQLAARQIQMRRFYKETLAGRT